VAASGAKAQVFLHDSYLEWARAEGLPVSGGLGVEVAAVETVPWPRLGGGARAALVHLDGRGDFVNCFVLELPPGTRTEPQRHLYEEVCYVLSGQGGTSIEGPDGRLHTFEWGPGSLFAMPLNARYRHFNASGREAARLASVTDLPLVLNTFHDQRFCWENQFWFRSRFGADGHFRGQGEFIPVRPGRHMWETNFVPDLRAFELQPWERRGVGSANIKFVLADGAMHAHMSELAAGTYKKAHRHGPDFHIFPVTGRGYSLFWYEGDREYRRIDWGPGWVYAPPDQMFHQHFNTSPTPSRYLAVAFGSIRYPVTIDKRGLFGNGVDVDVNRGGRQIEYEAEDPRIAETYRRELARWGLEPDARMQEIWSHTNAGSRR
jgi:uncharacterized RmlC-like cupin family protein